MFIELYILIEIIMIFCFVFAYFTKQELLWILSIVLSGILMMSSHNIEYHTSYATVPFLTESYNLPYMVSINFLFLALGLLLGLFDIFEKYGIELIWRWFKKK